MAQTHKTHKKKSLLREHSLSIVTGSILALWIVLYSHWDPQTHWGSFFGNAIADWTGVVVTVLATKYFYEKGSAESRKPPDGVFAPLHRFLRQHSLSIFLIATGIVWVFIFTNANPSSKWGQVVGNVVSEWTQLFGMVILTKRLVERHSKESHSNR